VLYRAGCSPRQNAFKLEGVSLGVTNYGRTSAESSAPSLASIKTKVLKNAHVVVGIDIAVAHLPLSPVSLSRSCACSCCSASDRNLNGAEHHACWRRRVRLGVGRPQWPWYVPDHRCCCPREKAWAVAVQKRWWQLCRCSGLAPCLVCLYNGWHVARPKSVLHLTAFIGRAQGSNVFNIEFQAQPSRDKCYHGGSPHHCVFYRISQRV
jgi:hypothetical protein